MWIDRKELDDLKKRIRDLESAQEQSGWKDYFTVWKKAEPYGNSLFRLYPTSVPSQKILVKDAVEKIMRHLKLDFEYVDGKPETVDVKKQPSPRD